MGQNKLYIAFVGRRTRGRRATRAVYRFGAPASRSQVGPNLGYPYLTFCRDPVRWLLRSLSCSRTPWPLADIQKRFETMRIAVFAMALGCSTQSLKDMWDGSLSPRPVPQPSRGLQCQSQAGRSILFGTAVPVPRLCYKNEGEADPKMLEMVVSF